MSQHGKSIHTIDKLASLALTVLITVCFVLLQFTKLEESFKERGLQGATEYVRQLSAERVCVCVCSPLCVEWFRVVTVGPVNCSAVNRIGA